MRRGMYRPASTSSQAGALTPEDAPAESDSIRSREVLPCSRSGVLLRARFIVLVTKPCLAFPKGSARPELPIPWTEAFRFHPSVGP